MNKEHREIRLFDSQWINIVNHENCFAELSKEDAVAAAVKMTEKAMSRNFEDNNWPHKRRRED